MFRFKYFCHTSSVFCWRRQNLIISPSGGKDSCFNMMHCVAEGHEIVALANLKPKEKDELDSYMYQTVGHHAIDLYADAMGLPLFRRTIEGGAVQQGSNYEVTAQDEVEDLYMLLSEIKKEIEYEGVSVGAILSDYQRVRVEHVCARLGVTSLAYLWRRDQKELLMEMIDCQVEAILIKVAALGLTPEKHLGKSLEQIQPHMLNMSEKYGLNPCGEGGEYETFTLDCPLFNKKIVIDEQDVVMHSEDAFAPVAYLNFKEMHLEEKIGITASNYSERIKDLQLKRSCDIYQELNINCDQKIEVSPQSETACITCTLNKLNIPEYFISPCRGGKWCSISCVLGWKDKGSTIEEQTKRAMETLSDILQKQSLAMYDLVAVHLYVSNMSDFAKVNSIYKTYFGINPPIRICVEINLPTGVMLQLDCLAYHKSDDQSVQRRTMHVQGLSHWAPANIGPYSQSVQVGDMIYVAGQIALIPGSMKIIEGGIVSQAVLSIRHVKRVLKAMNVKCGLNCVRLAICYLTNQAYIKVAEKHWKEAMGELVEQKESSKFLLQCVVVPSLPRDAFIEWQVYATQEPTRLIEETNDTKSNEDFRSCCTCQVAESGSGQFCSFICYAELQKVDVQCDSKEKAGRLWHVTLECIKQTLQKLCAAECVTKLLTTFRVFYCSKYFENDHLYTEYSHIFHEVFGEDTFVVPPAFVPVISLEDEQHILTVSH